MFTEKTAKILTWVSLILLLISIFIFIVFSEWEFSFIIDEAIIGQFGDFVGGVIGCIIAFIGIILYYEALKAQREDIKISRELLETEINAFNQQVKEFKLQTEELSETRKIYEEQNKTMKRQRFENTFFNMLSLQQEIVANLSIEWKEREWYELEGQWKERVINNKGREVFEKIYEGINVQPIYMPIGIKKIVNQEIENYNKYRELISRFDHYFRHLYRIFKYIDKTDLIDEKERYDYASIVRSQLSDYELVMLFYNCLAQKDNGKEENKFKPLIEKYAIFNNLRDGLLAKEDHYKLYNDGAYEYKKQI